MRKSNLESLLFAVCMFLLLDPNQGGTFYPPESCRVINLPDSMVNMRNPLTIRDQSMGHYINRENRVRVPRTIGGKSVKGREVAKYDVDCVLFFKSDIERGEGPDGCSSQKTLG